MFYEASTRTRVSFEQAGKILSADVINVSGHGSSVEKGESFYNTSLTIQAMNADIIVIRHPHSGAPYFLARHLAIRQNFKPSLNCGPRFNSPIPAVEVLMFLKFYPLIIWNNPRPSSNVRYRILVSSQIRVSAQTMI